MTALFEFLFKYRPIVYERGTIAWQAPWPSWVSWLLAVAAAGVAYLLYARTAGVLPAGWRAALSLLRAGALALLVVALHRPVLIVHTVLPQKSFVAVAYDVSKSMEIRDGEGGESRVDVVRRLLRPADNPVLADLGRKFRLRFFRFAGEAARVEGFQDAPRHGNVTDLERALDGVAGELGGAPVSGVVLLTDGADNHSRDLSAAARRLRARSIPVYSVGIGSAAAARDAEVTRVGAPRRVLKDAMIEAEVAVRARGYAGRRAKLTVKERERPVHTQEITLGGDGEVRSHLVHFSSDTAGAKVFAFRVEPFPDELIRENNASDVLVRVEDEKPQVLYTEGEPRWEYKFLRRSVGEDKNLRLVALLRQAAGKFYRQGVEDPGVLERGFPSEKSELFAYKGLVLGSVEASFFTFDQLRIIADFVGQRGGSLLVLGGRNSLAQGGYANTPLEDVLPVSLRFGGGGVIPAYQDLEYKVRLTGYGMLHPVTRLSAGEEENRKRWASVPSLVGLNPTGGAKPGATVLASAAAAESRGAGPVVLAFQRFGRGRSAVLATASTWRWRMELEHRDNTHELFWKQMLRWLVSDVPDPVNVEPEKHSLSPEESVALRAEVNDASFVHLNSALVTAEVKAPSGRTWTVPLAWDVKHEGQYGGIFKPLEEGIHEVTVTATQGGRALGTARSSFRVAESTEEFRGAGLNADLLRRLSAETHGRYYTPSELKSLAEDIALVDNGASRVEERDLWDMPAMFLLLAAFMSAEWALRKRRGLA